MVESSCAWKQRPVLDISNVIAAFSEDQVENITGLSKGRLRYWAKTNFFKPSFIEDNPRMPYSRFYSFRDIVGLRTLEMLRVKNGVPLQHLRKVAEELSHLSGNLWAETKLYAFNRRVVLVNPATDIPEEVVSGQYALSVALEQVIEDTKSELSQLRRRSPDSIGKIQKRRSIARNAWAVAGTRIAVHSIKRLAEDGYSVEQIIEEYPDLTREDVEAALRHEGPKAA